MELSLEEAVEEVVQLVARAVRAKSV